MVGGRGKDSEPLPNGSNRALTNWTISGMCFVIGIPVSMQGLSISGRREWFCPELRYRERDGLRSPFGRSRGNYLSPL